MKPDKKYMSMFEDELLFEPFYVDSSFRDLNSSLSSSINPINLNLEGFLNVNSETPRTIGSQFDLRQEALKAALGEPQELYCYNRSVAPSLNNKYNLPMPTDILRDFDMDLDENDLINDYDSREQFKPTQPFPPTIQPFPPSTKPLPPSTKPFPPTTKPFPPGPAPLPPGRCNPEVIFQRIRVNNPMILRTMSSYGIPFPIARTLIKRIIDLTNTYCRRE